MKEKEIERKALLSREEYTALFLRLSAIAAPVSYRQVNHYYDTEELLLSALSATLRVREKRGVLTLEYKHSQKRVGEVRFAVEDTRVIDAIPETVAGAELPDTDPTLVFYRLGALTTDRTDFKIGAAPISLDKSEYLGMIDYEIEVETPTDALPPDVAALSIDFSRDVRGKYHRFLQRFRGVN